MGWWNDSNAYINSNGNLSLGGSGFDDAGYDATHPYAKGDCYVTVEASQLVGDTLPALTYLTGNIPSRTLAASTTHKVMIPLEGQVSRTYASVVGQTANPHGFKVRSMALFYRVNTTNITSITCVLQNYQLIAAAALPTVILPAVTLAGGTVTQAANVYALVMTVTTPVFYNAIDTITNAMATIVIPGSSTVDLMGASWRLSVALY